MGYLGKLACLGNVPMVVVLAFSNCLWGMRWPCLHALAMVALPMGIALNLAVWLCRGCFPMEAIKAWKHARGLTIALTVCLQELAWPWLLAHWMIIFQNMSLFGQASMPWPWQNANGGCLGFYCSFMGDVLALATYLSRGVLSRRCCLEHGCVALA